MEIFRILDELELMIKDGKKVPLSGKSLLDGHIILERVDRIRAILPEELHNARLIIHEKDRIVTEACAEADEFMEESKGKIARLVDESEITKNAMKVADEIIFKSEHVAKEIRRDANEYAEGVLAHMEIVLTKGLEAVSEGKMELQYALKDEDY